MTDPTTVPVPHDPTLTARMSRAARPRHLPLRNPSASPLHALCLAEGRA
ncbi:MULTISPECIES: hypothetical protein [Nocardia]|nr:MULTISPECIES: hypothetical protein [Nocardia]